MRRALLFLFLALVFLMPVSAYSNSYSKTFSTTENPLSDGGNWIAGTTDGFNSNVDSQSNLAYGTSPTTPPPYDSMALLTGTWGPDQSVQATVYAGTIANQPAPEVELYCRSSMTSTTLSGYCATFSVKRGSSGYLIIVKLVNATGAGGGINQIVAAYSGSTYDCQNGDVVKMLVVGNTIAAYKNGTLMGSAYDTALTSGGSPGFGFNEGGGGANTTYGISSFSASDGAIFPNPRKLQGTNGANPSGCLTSLAFTNNVTLGSLMFCTVAWAADTTHTGLPTVGDTLGNTWAQAKALYSNAAADKSGVALWYAVNTKGNNAANTVQISYASPTYTIASDVIIDEFSGCAASSPMDGTGAIQLQSGLSSGSSPTSGNFTTSLNGDLLYSAIFNAASSGAPSDITGSGFLASQTPWGYLGTEYQIQATASGSTAGTWSFTDSQSDDLITLCAAFKAAAGTSRTWNGKTLSTWDGKTISTWDGVTGTW